MSVAVTVAVASAVHSYTANRRAAKKARRLQEAAKEAARGMYVAVEGEIVNAPVAYGRTKIAGARVFHRVQNDYTYAPETSDELLFVSKGDPRRLNRRLPNVIVSKVSYSYYLIISSYTFDDKPIYIISYDATDDYYNENSFASYSNLVTGSVDISGVLEYTSNGIYRLIGDASHAGVTSNFELGTPQLTIGTVGAKIRLSHPAWYRDLEGHVVADITEANYEVISFADNILTLKGPDLTAENAPTSEVQALSYSMIDYGNRLLIFKQVLGVDGLSDIHHVMIDDQDFRNDKFDTRIIVNKDGGTPGSMFLANCQDQVNSKFPGYAHATCAVWINRDEPQFAGVPDLLFFVEGRKVHKLIESNGVITLSSTKHATNNLALILLDYLLDNRYGKALSVDEIDLTSFYIAYLNCDRYLQINGSFDIPVTGYLWQEKYRLGTPRRLRLGEYNGTIDTGKSVRDNVEQILKDLYDADLIWSDGKYRLLFTYPEEYKPTFDSLSLGKIGGALPVAGQPAYYNKWEIVQYPPGPVNNVDLYMSVVDSNTNPPVVDATIQAGWIRGPHQSLVCAYLTDDDIIADDIITQVWTPTQDRLNHCTIRFFNESKDFAEDSISWPAKYNGTVIRGINGRTFTFTTYNWTGSQYGEFLTANSIWNGTGYSVSNLQWKFYCQASGSYTLQFAADDSGTINISGGAVNTSLSTMYTGAPSATPTETTVDLVKDIVYTITVNATNIRSFGGVAGVLYEKSTNRTWWTTRSISYENIWLETETSSVYETYLSEDGQAILETEEFIEGVSNEWHARAHAEYRVRSSRNSSRISLVISRKNINLEPGDIIKLTSDVLQIPGELYKIDEFKVNESSNIVITAVKFDARNLAWNAKDDEVVAQRNIYRTRIGQAKNLVYTADCLSPDYAGRLEWTASDDSRVDSYIIYRTPCLITALTADTVWTNVGETIETYFNPPRAAVRNWTYAVAAKIFNGRTSVMYDMETGDGWPMTEARADSMITLPQPEPPMIYCTPDSTGTISKLRVNMTFEQNPKDDFNGVFMLAAYSDRPNRFRIANLVGNRLYVEAFSLAQGMTFEMPILADSTSRRVIVTTGTLAPDDGFSEWWAQLVRNGQVVGHWKNVTGIDNTAVYFDIPFETTPQVGDILRFAATTWEDNRAGEFKLGFVNDGNAYEVIRWDTVTSDGHNFWVNVVQRGVEGSDILQNVVGKDFWYYPAPGKGTSMIKVDKGFLKLGENGEIVAEGELPVSISSGNSISLAAGVFFEENGIVKRRSNIVPAIYGGEL